MKRLICNQLPDRTLPCKIKNAEEGRFGIFPLTFLVHRQQTPCTKTWKPLELRSSQQKCSRMMSYQPDSCLGSRYSLHQIAKSFKGHEHSILAGNLKLSFIYQWSQGNKFCGIWFVVFLNRKAYRQNLKSSFGTFCQKWARWPFLTPNNWTKKKVYNFLKMYHSVFIHPANVW